MTKRREIEARLALYSDLTGIIGAMKSFALVELRRVGQREAAQHQAMQAVENALRDMAPALQPMPKTKGDIWLLFGSVRGFCGSFNEDVRRAWQEKGGTVPVIAVGERLAALLPEDGMVTVPGAVGALDAAATIDRILEAIAQARGTNGKLGLMAALRDENGVTTQRLLPLPDLFKRDAKPLPFTNEPADDVAHDVAERYLYHALMALLLRAIRIENHMRLMQMENALTHLDRGAEELGRKRNRLRQEEIVEEIELIAGSTKPMASI